MSSSQAELTLILKAKSLADTEFSKIKAGLGGLADKASSAASSMASAFKGIGGRIATQMGNLAMDILSGGNVVTHLLNVGAIMAGAAVEGVMSHFIPNLLGKLAATELFAPVAAALSAEGATLGGVLAAAIPVGMAALPFLLAAAAVAALVFLLTHPEVLQAVHDFAVSLVTGIVNGIASLPGKIADVVRSAFENLHLDIGPFHISAAGVTIDLPDINAPYHPTGGASEYGKGPGHAAGGWVGLHGPELSWLGEKGPEYVIPNHELRGGGSPGVRIVGVSEDDIERMIQRKMYVRLQRAGSGQTAG